MPRPPQVENLAPPAVGYGSLMTFLDHLNTFGEPPNVVNNRVFPSSFSGTTIALTLRALRFFDLINEDGRPDEAALKPMMNPETRQAAIAELLKEKYSGLFRDDLPLSKAGPGEIKDYFGSFGVDATAARKARSFFLQAAKESGIAVHGSVTKTTRTRGKTGKRKLRGKGSEVTPDPNRDTASQNGDKFPKGDIKTISLRSGNGHISLVVHFEPISISTEDRAFIFDMIDRLNSYEQKQGAQGGSPGSS